MGNRVRIRLNDAIAPRPRPRPTGPTLLDAIADPRLFKSWFKDTATWAAWFAFIAALFALPMSDEQLAVYRRCTGRTDPPTSVATETFLICGRRAGKSFVLALCAVFLAAFHEYRQFLAPGERGTVFVIATDRKQARIILRYIRALLTQVPMLARMIEREWAEGFDLSNSVTIEVATASFRSTRGFTLCCCLIDELAFFVNEDGSSAADHAVLAAIRPGMATIPNAMLLCASSPYARKGALFEAHKDHYAKDGDPILVWQADTRSMNPSVPQSFIDAEYERDPASASAEYGAQFRSDIEAFVSLDTINACISDGVTERPRQAGVNYSSFIDPAGGSGKDSFTLAIGHKDKTTGNCVVDCIREVKPPFSPDVVVEDFAKLLKSYGVRRAISDRYAGEWLKEPFKKQGVVVDSSAAAKSDLYRDALPLLNSHKVDLLDHPKMVQQFIGLERRTARSGKDSIDHSPNSHDDICNVVAGLLVNIGVKKYKYDASMEWVDGPHGDSDSWKAMQTQTYLNSGGRYRL